MDRPNRPLDGNRSPPPTAFTQLRQDTRKWPPLCIPVFKLCLKKGKDAAACSVSAARNPTKGSFYWRGFLSPVGSARPKNNHAAYMLTHRGSGGGGGGKIRGYPVNAGRGRGNRSCPPYYQKKQFLSKTIWVYRSNPKPFSFFISVKTAMFFLILLKSHLFGSTVFCLQLLIHHAHRRVTFSLVYTKIKVVNCSIEITFKLLLNSKPKLFFSLMIAPLFI